MFINIYLMTKSEIKFQFKLLFNLCFYNINNNISYSYPTKNYVKYKLLLINL